MSFVALLSSFVVALTVQDPQAQELRSPAAPQWKRAVMPKELAATLPIAADQTRVVVKLAEQQAGLATMERILDTGVLAAIDGRPSHSFFRGKESELANIRARQLAACAPGTVPPVDLALYFEVEAKSAADARALITRLNALVQVELAYPRELPTPPPGDILPVTPDYTTSNQAWLAPTPNGFDGAHVRSISGAMGGGIKVLDIEWGWNFAHEDLAKLRPSSLVGPPIANTSYNNHGDAVAGELSADADIYGVTGLTPDVQMFVATDYPASGYSVANAITAGLPVLGSGDVMLLEAQTNTPLGLGPTEWIQADFDAILIGTTLGVICVEAAGNGAVNLDSPTLNGLFNTSVRDSGAIIVGATDGVNLVRAGFSTYGSRIDANGWGYNVASTGYGDLFNPGDVRQHYTNAFSGTSSASPMVTATVIALRGAAKAQLAPAAAAALDMFAIRALLRLHGQAVAQISRRPDTRALLAAAGVTRGVTVRNEPTTGQTCFVEIVPSFTAGSGDFWAMVGGLTASNVPMPAPYQGRVLIDSASSVPLVFGSFAAIPGSLSVTVPNSASFRGLRYLVQGYTWRTATNTLAAQNCVTLFVRT